MNTKPSFNLYKIAYLKTRSIFTGLGEFLLELQKHG